MRFGMGEFFFISSEKAKKNNNQATIKPSGPLIFLSENIPIH